jgi:3-hydroxyisobutyrate dehydrogenase-like beta-hydroxyacid dehydrogenase
MSGKVTVIGTGNMGSALARALIDARHEVTVWNRTSSKAERLAEFGALVAPDEAAAVGASPLVVVCLAQYDQVEDALERANDRGVLAGRTVVNLTWGTHDAAREMTAWCEQRGAGYLDGMIDCYPSDIGTPTGILIYGGPAELWHEHEEILGALGKALYLGSDPTGPNVHANATGIIFYHTALAAFYEAAAYASHYGVKPRELLPTMDVMLDMLARNFERGVDHIEGISFGTDQASMKIHWEACAIVSDELETIGQRGRLTAATTDMLEHGVQSGDPERAIAGILEELEHGL